MSTARYLIGDVFERMAALEDGSVDLVLTSPPFLALRSYLPADHPDKGKEIGSEPTPAAFLDTLLALTAEWRRLLTPHGSICVELGDTYSGSGGRGGDYAEGGMREGQPGMDGSAKQRRIGATERQRQMIDTHVDRSGDTKYEGQRLQDRKRASHNGNKNRDSAPGWPLDKSLCGIPHLYHLSLAYGRNLLTGEPSPAGQWRVRNVVAWCRPNPPVGALGDKFRPGTSYMTVACVSGQRYFDLDAVRGNPEDVKDQRHRTTNGPKQDADPSEVLTANYHQRIPSHPAGPPPLDWWEIPTQAYAGSHYATWPSALCEKPVKAMVPRRVCTTCGEPSRRIAETTNAIGSAVGRRAWRDTPEGKHSGDITESMSSAPTAERVTLGWTDCGHDAWRNGLVLDPFAGSGTTLAVATGHGRDAIGIDIDNRNAELARERVGMFLTIEEQERVA